MDIDELKAKAKELGIPHAHVMGEERLKEEIAKKEADPDAPEEDLNAGDAGLEERQLEAKQGATIAELQKMVMDLSDKVEDQAAEKERLQREMDTLMKREIPEKPNPNVIRYKKEGDKIISRQVTPKMANILERDGWVDTPAKIEGHVPQEPKKEMGVKIEGKIYEG